MGGTPGAQTLEMKMQEVSGGGDLPSLLGLITFLLTSHLTPSSLLFLSAEIQDRGLRGGRPCLFLPVMGGCPSVEPPALLIYFCP